MHLLLVSTDPTAFTKGSDFQKRHARYGELVERISIIARGGSEEVALSPTVTLYPTSGSKLFWGVRARAVARSIHAKQPVDVVSAQDPFEVGLLGLSIARRLGAKLHIQLHTDPFSSGFGFRPVNAFRKRLLRFVLEHANCVRVVSEQLVENVKQYTDAPVSVLPVFVDPTRFAQASRGGKRILVVSRLEPEKRIAKALFIFARLLKEEPDATLTILGEGRERGRIERMVRVLGIEGKVSLLGHVPDIAPYYASHDVLLHTSRFEGYGLALVEARLSGLPVVSTDVGVAKEVGAHIFSEDEEVVELLQKSFTEDPEPYTPPYVSIEGYLEDWKDQFRACV